MFEVKSLNRFRRQPDGVWACAKPIKIDGHEGPIIIGHGASFGPGALFMGFDVAKELDQMAAKRAQVLCVLLAGKFSAGYTIVT